MNKPNFYLAIVFAMMLPFQEGSAEVSSVDNSGTLLNREQTSVHNAQALPDSGVPNVLPGALTMQANSIFSVDNSALSVAPQEMRFMPYDGSSVTSAPLFSNQFTHAPSFSGVGINESYESGLLAQEVPLEPVPEPTTWVVAAMVACFMLLRLRHRSRATGKPLLSNAQ